MKTYCNATNANSTQGQVNLIVALPCEAKPIVHALGLKKNTLDSHFAVYRNAQGNCQLIVSGVGPLKAAMATIHLHHVTAQKPYACYLNIGIAGSGFYPVGSLILANKIVEDASNKTYYPKTFYLPKAVTKTQVTTFQNPQHQYPDEGCVDMEAYGFFMAASEVVCQEQVQVIKIIADTPETGIDNINKETVNRLMIQRLDTIMELYQRLLRLSAQEQSLKQAPKHMATFLKRWHFSVSQQRQLTHCLRRWTLCYPQQNPMAPCEPLGSAKDVLHRLSEQCINIIP